MLASKQRAGITFWRAASCKNLALNQIFRGATKAGIPRRISQRTVWAQTGPIPYYVSAALSLGQSGLRLCTYLVHSLGSDCVVTQSGPRL
jgi:hypothetical protein